jgi:CheY-like chemotaxis protein
MWLALPLIAVRGARSWREPGFGYGLGTGPPRAPASNEAPGVARQTLVTLRDGVSRETRHGYSRGGRARAQGVHVLGVEDTDDSREALRLVLEYCGALVIAAESAEKAKQILETVRPHVLVTDVTMPDDGLELVREVRTVAEMKGIHIPAIAITAYRGRGGPATRAARNVADRGARHTQLPE